MTNHDSSSILRLGPPLAQARSTIILLHGRGSSAEDIAGLAKVLPVEGVALIAPNAAGGTWYPQRFFAPLQQNEPSLSRALGAIDALVNEAIAAGISSERIGLVGFSQGACLALEYAVRHPRRYGFVAGLSGALIGPLDTVRRAVDLLQTPVLVACAESDGHIPLDHVEQSAAALSRFGAMVTKQIFPGGAHTVFPEEITWLKAQINRPAAKV